MRRAIAAAALTIAGLVALLDYRSGSTTSSGAASASGSTTTTAPSPSAGATTSTTTAGSSSTATATTDSATGEVVTYQYGDIEVRVTVLDGKITSVTVPRNDAPDFRSEQINTQAVPQLTSETLSAQGASIEAVSGATYTSDAFIQSLQSALAKVAR